MLVFFCNLVPLVNETSEGPNAGGFNDRNSRPEPWRQALKASQKGNQSFEHIRKPTERGIRVEAGSEPARCRAPEPQGPVAGKA